MPTIIRPRDVKRKKPREVAWKNPTKEEHTKMYMSREWRNLSNIYRSLHPLDELLLLEDKIVLSSSCHHVVSPFAQRDESLKYMLLLDEENLLSLSSEEHGYIHGNPSELSDLAREKVNQKIDYIVEKDERQGYFDIKTSYV